MNPASRTQGAATTWRRPYSRIPTSPHRKTRKRGIQMEYIGFTPSDIAKSAVERMISAMLVGLAPEARVSGSVIAMRGGFEAFLDLSVGLDSFTGGAVGIDWIRAVRRCVNRISEQMGESWAPR